MKPFALAANPVPTEMPESLPSWLTKAYALLFALLPWSIDLDLGNWNIFLPAEPLLLAIGIGVFYEMARARQKVWKQVRGNSLLLLSFAWIVWMAVSVLFSSMRDVSLKYWVVEAGHWWVFGIAFVRWPSLWHTTMPYFLRSILVLAVYTFIHHGFLGFRAGQALLAPMPFFSDHTIYSTVLLLVAFLLQIPPNLNLGKQRRWDWLLLVVLALLLLLAGSRGAILSGMVVTGVYVCIRFYRKHKRWILGGLLLAALAFPLLVRIAAERLAHDVSYQERLNRWECVAIMVQIRPWTGFGPGTFPFQYIPYQKEEKMTRISLRQPLTHRGPDTYGRGGGVHSEYGQAAVEMGWPGLLIWLALVLGSLWMGFRLALSGKDAQLKRQALFLALGLTTFFLHGLINNFLHDGRVAALVWTGIAWISVAESKRNIERN